MKNLLSRAGPWRPLPGAVALGSHASRKAEQEACVCFRGALGQAHPCAPVGTQRRHSKAGLKAAELARSRHNVDFPVKGVLIKVSIETAFPRENI